jgi:hypothetical protein
MIEERPVSLASVEPGVPSLIQNKWWIKFSNSWDPSRTNVVGTKPNGSPYGRFFQVVATNQVAHTMPYIIPANDYRDVDFSDSAVAPGIQENLYPRQDQTLYEIQLGFKPANFLAQFYIPASQVLGRLEQTTMQAPDPPTVTALNFTSPLRYLGARKYTNSQYTDKKIYIYTIKDMDALIMRLFVDSGLPVIATDYEKIVAVMIVNKLKLVEIPTQFDNATGAMVYPNQKMIETAREIPYYTDNRW